MKIVTWKHNLVPGLNSVVLPKAAHYLQTALWQTPGSAVIYSVHQVEEKEPMRMDKVYVAMTGESFEIPDSTPGIPMNRYLGTVQTSHGMVGHVWVLE